MGESRYEKAFHVSTALPPDADLYGQTRQELLAWLNNLLQLNVTKVEQCGTG